MAVKKNFTLYRGTAPKILVGPIKDLNGAVLDVTGWTARLTVRRTATQADPPVFIKDLDVYGAPSAGYMRVALTSSDTLGFQARDYDYSVERTNVGFEDLLVIGTMTVELDIFHAKA